MAPEYILNSRNWIIVKKKVLESETLHNNYLDPL